MFLVKEKRHTGNNHGALYRVKKEFDERGKPSKVVEFMGNVVCPNLDLYLAENPDVRVVESIPD